MRGRLENSKEGKVNREEGERRSAEEVKGRGEEGKREKRNNIV